MIQLTAKNKSLADYLKQEALALGFDCMGVTSPNALDLPERLQAFLDAGRHGSMDWMADTAERRSDPKKLWPDVCSIAMVGMNYGPDFNPLDQLRQKDRGVISVYARNRDYHQIIKGRLKTLAAKLLSRARKNGQDGDVKVFVDTAPVMEKPMAAKAGLGWQGKHTNLVSREFGSWLFLGAIFTTLDLGESQPETDHCGSCHDCLDICPTQAFPAPYQLDARRCLSYLSIENKGPIPVEFRAALGNRIFGCDDCLAVCPWNKFASQTREAKLASTESDSSSSLLDLLKLDDAAFRQRFSGSPVKRIGRERFIRNCLIAAGNSGHQVLAPAIKNLMNDPSPLIRGASVWAFFQLSPHEMPKLHHLRDCESDQTVMAEWRLTEGE